MSEWAMNAMSCCVAQIQACCVELLDFLIIFVRLFVNWLTILFFFQNYR